MEKNQTNSLAQALRLKSVFKSEYTVEDFMQDGKGPASGRPLEEIIGPELIKIGMAIEAEHSKIPAIQKKITWDHSVEPGGKRYYILLPLMERILEAYADADDEVFINAVVEKFKDILEMSNA